MMSDRDLQARVVASLERSLGRDARAIGVDVEDGVVTLCGQVDGLALSQQAEAAARAVDGVQDICIAIELALPGSHAQHEHDLVVGVRRALAQHAVIPPDAIKVTVADGDVTLSGEVDWACQRWAALEAAATVPGVISVQDRIVVGPTIGGEEIKANIQAALRRLAPSELRSLGISVYGRCVKLSGSVDSYAKYRAACVAAWMTPGVKTVITDDLRVVS